MQQTTAILQRRSADINNIESEGRYTAAPATHTHLQEDAASPLRPLVILYPRQHPGPKPVILLPAKP